MRVHYVELNEVKYPLVLSNRATMELESKGYELSGEGFQKASTSMTFVMTMLHLMMQSGERWAKKMGRPTPEVPSLEDLADMTDMGDLEKITDVLSEAIDGERHVEATPPKN